MLRFFYRRANVGATLVVALLYVHSSKSGSEGEEINLDC